MAQTAIYNLLQSKSSSQLQCIRVSIFRSMDLNNGPTEVKLNQTRFMFTTNLRSHSHSLSCAHTQTAKNTSTTFLNRIVLAIQVIFN